MLKFRVYANRNYWTTTGWKDDAVSNFDESAGGRVEGRAGDARGHFVQQRQHHGNVVRRKTPQDVFLSPYLADVEAIGIQVVDLSQ